MFLVQDMTRSLIQRLRKKLGRMILICNPSISKATGGRHRQIFQGQYIFVRTNSRKFSPDLMGHGIHAPHSYIETFLICLSFIMGFRYRDQCVLAVEFLALWLIIWPWKSWVYIFSNVYFCCILSIVNCYKAYFRIGCQVSI